MQSITHDDAPRTPECGAFDEALTDYLAGRLRERDAERLESHAAGCARCERVLDLGTRIPIADFAPPLPDAARGPVLAAIAARPHPTPSRTAVTRIASWRWPITGGAVLAAAAAALFFARSPSTPELRTESTHASIDTPAVAPSYDGNAAMERASRLALDQARTEFESLDAAAHEIEGALKTSPDDMQLRAYLSAVRARRGELMQRVKEATS